MFSFQQQVQNFLNQSLNHPTSILQWTPIQGGCINEAFKITTQNGSSFFVKSNRKNLPSFFQKESEGLSAIQNTHTIQTPKILGYQDHSKTNFIILEYLNPSENKQSFAKLAQKLASLHQTKTDHPYGFHNNNYLGSNIQINTWQEDWITFFQQNRLQYQISLAQTQGLWSLELEKLWNSFAPKLEQLLDKKPKKSLLHGDLWSGNFLFTQNAQPVLIDPAVYYGDPETDIAMTQLFGGFPPSFYQTYLSFQSLKPHYPERFQIYNLYHLLNHLNLFGKTYLNPIQNTFKRFI